MLKYMMGPHAETHRFNFMQMVFPRQVAERFMEAWGWLEREGFVAHRPNDVNRQGFFVTRAGQRVAQATNFDAWKQESMFPDGLDPIIMSKVKPEFLRGEYEMAVFRCFKEVEMRVRDKDPSLASESGVDLMNKGFGPNGSPAFCGFADLAIVLVLDEPRRDLGVSDFSADRFDVDFRGFGLWVPFVSPLSGNIRAAIATSPPDVGGREKPGTDACPLKIGGRNFRSDGPH